MLRHAEPARAADVLGAALADHGGGWRPPADARVAVDTAYLLLAAGLLAPGRPALARGVLAPLLGLDSPVGAG